MEGTNFKNNSLMEIKETPKQTLVEKYVELDDYVRLDMNMIQYPIFNTSKRKKVNEVYKYYFNKDKSSYLEIIPGAGDYVPGNREELVFLAIMKIFEKNGQAKEIFFTIKELMEEMKFEESKFKKDFEKVKKSLKRLATTNYKFRNSMYSNFEKKIIRASTYTTIFSLQVIEVQNEPNEELVSKLKSRYGKKFKNIYKLSFSSIAHYNLVNTGHLSYSYDLLLDIEDPISRKIYIYLEKARFSELYYEEELLIFANKIPISLSNGNIYKAIPLLKNKLDMLIELNLLKKYEIVEAKPLKNSILKFYFDESSNIFKEKVLLKSINKKREIQELIENVIFEVENFKNDKEIKENDVKRVIDILPLQFKNMKNIQADITKALKHYGLKKVLDSAFHINSLSKTANPGNLKTIFKKSLKESWYDTLKKPEIKNKEEVVEVVEIMKKTKKNEEEEILNLLMVYYLKKYENHIVEKLKNIYLEKTGLSVTQINMKFFTASFKILFKEFLLENDLNSLDKKDWLLLENGVLVIKPDKFLTSEQIEQEIEKFIFIYFLKKDINESEKNKCLKYFLLFIDYQKQSFNTLQEQFLALMSSFENYKKII